MNESSTVSGSDLGEQNVLPEKGDLTTSDLEITVLKQAQNELRCERDRAEMYLDLAGFIILGLDPKGKIEVLNKKGCQILGCSEPPIGRCWFDFIPEKWQKEIRMAFQLLSTGEGLIGDYENPIIDAHGQEHLIAWHNTVLRDESGKVVGTLSSGEDITERRRAEEASRETTDTLESLIKYANAPIIVWAPDLRIMKFNHAFEHLTGYLSSEVIGKPLEILFPIDLRERSMAMIDRTSAGEHWDSVEISIRQKDGTQRTALWNSATLYVPGTCTVLMTIAQGQDITQRKMAEEALIESEAKYRGLFENAPGPVTLRRLVFDEHGDIIDQILVDANPASLKAWGVSSVTEIRGKLYSEFLNPDMASWSLDQVKKMRALGKTVIEETHYGRDDLDYLMTIVPLGDEHVIATSIDITERKRFEKALKRSNEELKQFAYVASHDLQEPLRMIVSYMAMLERKYGYQLDSEAQEYIHYAVLGGSRMRELIDDLMQYSRVDTKENEVVPVDMNGVVEKTLFLLKVPIDEHGPEILVDPLPTVMADETKMVQVMQNLIGNAIKFHGAERSKIHISATQGYGEWIFAVKDNGIGFNMEYAEQIFQVFQKLHAKDKFEGTGIGLAIVKKIVERLGGRIWAESEEGKGATFFFTLPRVPVK